MANSMNISFKIIIHNMVNLLVTWLYNHIDQNCEYRNTHLHILVSVGDDPKCSGR